jgi:hypothetical protein
MIKTIPKYLATASLMTYIFDIYSTELSLQDTDQTDNFFHPNPELTANDILVCNWP